MKSRKPETVGQALVEYLLMLSLAVILVVIIQKGLKSSVFKLWSSFTKDIVAACPGCPVTGNSGGLNYGGR